MQIVKDVCYGGPAGWHSKREDDDVWLCLNKGSTGELRKSGSLYEFILDSDKSNRLFNEAEVFKFMKKVR